jgi:hypothetical protein
MKSEMNTLKPYEPPVTTAESMEVFTILAGSETPRYIELPFDTGESTSEALSNYNSSLWDDDPEE